MGAFVYTQRQLKLRFFLCDGHWHALSSYLAKSAVSGHAQYMRDESGAIRLHALLRYQLSDTIAECQFQSGLPIQAIHDEEKGEV